MDPQSTWRRLINAYAIRDFETAQVAAEDLQKWLQRGGFPPQILPDPWQMDHSWTRRLALAACRFVSSLRDK